MEALSHLYPLYKDGYGLTVTEIKDFMFSLAVSYDTEWYAGVAVPQVLQQLREFDAPAMQSCKPLPCGTGSCQNRRLREQTLTRKPCHCGSIKGG